MDIGVFIKSKRESLGLSQEQVAEACGVSKSSVSRWESGNISTMRGSRNKALAEVLHVSPLSLLVEPSTKAVSTSHQYTIPTDIAQSISKLNPAGLDALRSVLAGFTANPSFVESKQESV